MWALLEIETVETSQCAEKADENVQGAFCVIKSMDLLAGSSGWPCEFLAGWLFLLAMLLTGGWLSSSIIRLQQGAGNRPAVI